MTSHRAWKLLVAGLFVAALVAAPLPAVGHSGKINSNVTLKAGYGFFRGKVGSPMTACRANRTVRLFKYVDGPDPVLKSTTTNSTGEWAIFRAYQEGNFYVKVPARTIKRTSHTHTCKATSSLTSSAWPRVTPANSHGWSVTYFDCLDWASNPGAATPLGGGPIAVDGPETPPMGFGSWQLLHPDAPTNYSRSDTRWDGLDGQALSSFRSISFSSYIDDDAPPPNYPPPTVRLHVDVTGDGSTTEEITFTPSISAVVTDQWQKWTAGLSSTWETPGGPMTLSGYQAAHPSAEFEDDPHGVHFSRDCGEVMPAPAQEPQYLDAVIIRLTNQTLGFDFER
jgi:hypothetical protein